MMKFLFIFLALALVCWTSARQVVIDSESPQYQQQDQQSQQVKNVLEPRGNQATCFGLARRSRTRTVPMPVLYNRRSGQTSAVPEYLFSLDDRTIDRMEADGWEVRLRTVLIPEAIYQRVPVCCPWDAACYHGQRGFTKQQPLTDSTPCFNKGELLTQGDMQWCNCPVGYHGVRCEIPPQEPIASFPDGPIIPFKTLSARSGPYDPQPSAAEVMKQLQIQKQQVLSSRQSPMMSVSQNKPFLSINGHAINSMNPWQAQQMRSQALRMNLAKIIEIIANQQGQQLQHPVMEILKSRFSQLNIDSLLQSRLPVYNQMVAIVNPHVHRHLATPINPYGPQATTPLDSDPWDSQSGRQGHPVVGGYPYDQNQMVALAFQQYIQNIQRRIWGALSNGRGNVLQSNGAPPSYSRVPGPNPPQPMAPGLTRGVIKTISSNGVTITSAELPKPQDKPPINDVNHQTNIKPVTDTKPNPEPVINPQQQFPSGNRGDSVPTMPSGDELRRMSECRVLLEPRITMCMTDTGHDLSLEQFINPQYITAARDVCVSSDIVGQCIMRQDQACGEGTNVEMTRKMIDSVLQMMGMVCAQINTIDNEMSSVAPAKPEEKTPLEQPKKEGSHQPKNGVFTIKKSPITTTQAAVKLEYITQSISDKRPKVSDKFTTSRPRKPTKDETAVTAASKSNSGHHSVEPITTATLFPGAPLWLIITIGSVIILLIFVSLGLLVCLAFKRRRMKKEAELDREFERKPELLDAKLYTIGIPPPTYPTATLKTQDELSLPPLDLADDDKTLSDIGEEAEEDDDMKKPPISDDDADDESEEGAEKEDMKKKDKREKK